MREQILDLALAAFCKIFPNKSLLVAARGERLLQEERFEAATTEFRRALSLASGREFSLGSGNIFRSLARASMPGPQYTDHLRSLHDIVRPGTYLEIGVAAGKTLRLASAETHVIGIDPAPVLEFECPNHIQIYPISSDAFFEQVAPTMLPTLPRVSLAFIDGLHLFEQALRDFINVEACCSPDGVIAIHDTLPVAEVPALRSRSSKYWCGDVWKIAPCLECYRPDLNVTTLPCFPSGLTVVTGLNPGNTALLRSFDQVVGEFATVPFSLHEERFASILANVPNRLFMRAVE